MKCNIELEDHHDNNIHIGTKIESTDVTTLSAKNKLQIICCKISEKVKGKF